MAWTAGQTLQNGNYTIDSELGRGRFGITYLAKDKSGNYLALKTLDEDLLNKLPPVDRNNLESKFSSEALKLERCKHPHVVQVKETFIEGQLFCIAMEYIAGNTLACLGRRVLPEKEALAYIRQMGAALIEVHSKELLHRDVKPANIMVRSGSDQVVLIDFGLTAEFEHPLTSRWRDNQFAPMEVNASNQPWGFYTDVYSLAATLYFLLTGQLPASALERQDNNSRLIPPKEINPLISEQVNNAIVQGMSVEPEARPQTMGEWLDLLGLTSDAPDRAKKRKKMAWRWDIVIFWVVLGTLAILLATIVNLIANLNPPLDPHQEETSPTTFYKNTPLKLQQLLLDNFN
jgi:serine/threonine-protein kinase